MRRKKRSGPTLTQAYRQHLLQPLYNIHLQPNPRYTRATGILTVEVSSYLRPFYYRDRLFITLCCFCPVLCSHLFDQSWNEITTYVRTFIIYISDNIWFIVYSDCKVLTYNNNRFVAFGNDSAERMSWG